MSELLSLYRELHAAPELSFQEQRTAARLAGAMQPLGFRVTTGVGGHGVVAVLENGPGPVLLVRTDMDALPVRETTGLPFASKATAVLDGVTVPVMHACGHDIHMSAWVGTARRLAASKRAWSGTLVMIAQPAEERGGGAKAMLDDGLYTRFPKPRYALALHDWAELPAGTVAVAPGPVMANVDSVDVTIRGRGGHGAYPHTTIDPVVLAARTVLAWQTLVSREMDPQSPAVITVGSVHGGLKHNVIPDEVKLQLTVRSYTDAARDKLLKGIERVARGEAMAAGVPDDRMPLVEVKDEFTPAVYNDPELSERLARLFRTRFGPDRVRPMPATMGGEDFSRYSRDAPGVQGVMFRVGAVPAEKFAAAKGDVTRLPSLHSASFAPDPEPTIATAVEAMTAAALNLLAPAAGPPR